MMPLIDYLPAIGALLVGLVGVWAAFMGVRSGQRARERRLARLEENSKEISLYDMDDGSALGADKR